MMRLLKDVTISCLIGMVFSFILLLGKDYINVNISSLFKGVIGVSSAILIGYYFKSAEDAKKKVVDFKLDFSCPARITEEVNTIISTYVSSNEYGKHVYKYIVVLLLTYILSYTEILSQPSMTNFIKSFSFFTFIAMAFFSCIALRDKENASNKFLFRLEKISAIEKNRKELLKSLEKTKESFFKSYSGKYRSNNSFDINKYVEDAEKKAEEKAAGEAVDNASKDKDHQ